MRSPRRSGSARRAEPTGMEHACLSCMAYVLRELGRLGPRRGALRRSCRLPARAPTTRWWRTGCSGRSTPSAASGTPPAPLLAQCLETGTRLNVVSMTRGQRRRARVVDEHEGDLDGARDHCRFLLERWQRSEDHHYAVWGLRWAACFFARHGDARRRARVRRGAVEHRRHGTGHPDALAALAHALGETALAEGHTDAAAEQLTRAAELHEASRSRSSAAQIQLRAGVALAAAGQREAAVERLHAGACHRAPPGRGAAGRRGGRGGREARRVGRAAAGTARRGRPRQRAASRAASSR